MSTIIMKVHMDTATAQHQWLLAEQQRGIRDAPWQLDAAFGTSTVTVAPVPSATGVWVMRLAATMPFPEDVRAAIRLLWEGEGAVTHVLWPGFYGAFERYPVTGHPLHASFLSAGLPGEPIPAAQRLALPFAVLQTARGLFLLGTDPTFATTLTIQPAADGQTELHVSWTWRAAAGIHADEHRRLFLVPVTSPQEALDRWFTLATPDVPAGPAWLHDIALQDFDYLSKDGQGWFADIDAACALIAPADRHRALFCLHGWYDQIGRYCFDATTGQLDAQWEAFPSIRDPALQSRSRDTPVRRGIPAQANMAYRNLARYQPVPLTWDDLRARLRYAKERGLRTAVYALTGLQMSGDPAEHVSAGTGLAATEGLWQGPDLMGPTYIANPLHPAVRAQVLAYLRALLHEVGEWTDALVMDEAYYVGCGTLGPSACPGYADRAQMALIQECAALCHQYRPDLAFLTADLLGASWLEDRAFPYSLFADGIYQDSWCWPTTWDGVRFPTWRNVAWGCNWAPVSNFDLTRYAVLAHNAPLALSNGCFGDDTGLADMDADMHGEIATLWQRRKDQHLKQTLGIKDFSPAP